MGIKCTKCGYISYTATSLLEYAQLGCGNCPNHEANTFIRVDKEDIKPPVTEIVGNYVMDCPTHGKNIDCIEYTGAIKIVGNYGMDCPTHGKNIDCIEYTGAITEYLGKYCWLCLFDLLKHKPILPPVLKHAASADGSTNHRLYSIVYENIRLVYPEVKEIVVLQVDGQPILVYDLTENKLKSLVRLQAAGMDLKLEKVEPPPTQEHGKELP